METIYWRTTHNRYKDEESCDEECTLLENEMKAALKVHAKDSNKTETESVKILTRISQQIWKTK